MHWILIVSWLVGSFAATALPRMTIATEGARPVESREEYLPAELRIDAIDGASEWTIATTTRVRGRGNSTWDMPKRPLKLHLDRAQSLLGLPAHRDWSLLANYADKTLVRNLLAFFVSARLALGYSPRAKSVWLNVNGRDQGVYLLTEEVSLSSGRLNLVADDDTGGYLLEIDQRREGEHRFVTKDDVPYAIAAPNTPSAAQVEYIRDYVQRIEDTTGDGYADFIEVDTFVDAYLVNEILKNSDSANFSSIYLHKSSGGKLRMGPLWDYDLAAGNTDYTDAQFPTGWWIREQSPWYRKLFADPKFEALILARWRQLPALGLGLDDLKDFIDARAAELAEAQRENFRLWPTLDVYVWPNAVVTGSYAAEIDYLKSWLTVRIRWMDMQFRNAASH